MTGGAHVQRSCSFVGRVARLRNGYTVAAGLIGVIKCAVGGSKQRLGVAAVRCDGNGINGSAARL
jgi:hypothetical protein